MKYFDIPHFDIPNLEIPKHFLVTGQVHTQYSIIDNTAYAYIYITMKIYF